MPKFFQHEKANNVKLLKRVLIAVHHSAFSNVLYEIIDVLRKSGRYEPIVFVANEKTLKSINLNSIHADRITCFDPSGKLILPLNTCSLENSIKFPAEYKIPVWRRMIKEFLRNPPKPVLIVMQKIQQVIFPILDIVFHLLRLIKLVTIVRRLIRKLNISALVIGSESQFYGSPASVKAARLEHIPVLNAVMFFASNGGEIPQTLLSWPSHGMNRWVNRLTGTIYPNWVGEYNGNRFLYLPGEEALAQEWLNMAHPQHPTGESNYSDVILVECERIREYAISAGCPPEKLIVTGEVIHDLMAESLNDAVYRRENLYKELGLSPNKPLLLSGLAPNRRKGRETVLSSWDFQSYTEMIEFWAKSLAALKDYNIIFTIHPSEKYEDICFVEQWGGRIVREKTSSLIPLCDIYVTDGVSSTIPWAIACGKPVVEYDVFRWGLSSFEEGTGVLRVVEKSEFLSALDRLTRDGSYYAQTVERQKLAAKQWGNLDGKSEERILQLFDRLIFEYERMR